MESKLLDYIIASSLTQNEILERIQLLKDALERKMFGADPSSEQDPLSSPANREWLNGFDPRLLEGITKNNIDTVVAKLVEAVKGITPLVVFLPFEIPRPELARFITSLRQNYGPNLMVEIKLDPNLIAGAALVWKGVYKDYSIHQRISDNRNQIIEMFQKYIR